MYQSEYPQCALVLILRFNYSICLTSKIYAPLSIRSPHTVEKRQLPTTTTRILDIWHAPKLLPHGLHISDTVFWRSPASPDPTRKTICWFPSPNQPPSPARWSEELKPQNTPPFQSDGFLSYENLELAKETFEKGSTYCWWKKSCTSW